MAGSVKQRPDGKWRARYRDELGKEHAAHRATKKAAQAWLDEQTAKLVTGTWADPAKGRQTFAAYFATFKARQLWAPGTVRAVELAVASTPFAERPIGGVNRGHVEAWVRGMADKGLAAGTIRTRFNNVRTVFRGAVSDRVIGEDPTEGVALPRQRRRAASLTIPTSAQVGRLLEAAGDDFAPFIGLCAFAGLRLGEAAAIRVSDVNLSAGTLQVARQVQRAGGGLVEVRAPKYGSERVVFIPERLGALILDHAIAHELDADAYLWTDDAGQPLHQNTIGHRWRQTRKAAKLDGLRLHDLRHYYASGLIAAGCDVVTVQRALGHGSAAVTLGTYSHLWPTAEDRTRAAAAGLMAEACGPGAD